MILQKLQTLLKKSNIGKYFLTKTRLSHKDSDDLAKYIVDHLLQKSCRKFYFHFHLFSFKSQDIVFCNF